MPFAQIHYKRFLILGLFFLALILRFYGFSNWFGFDYDQEINAWIGKSIVIDHKQTLIGPETSVGAMYVGSLFNYVIAVFLFFSQMNPMGTIFLNVILFTLMFASLYFAATSLFNFRTAVIALAIYSFSSMAIGYDRVLWNPTPIPLVCLWLFYFLAKFIDSGKLRFLVLVSSLCGLLFHLHFQVFVVLAVVSLALILFKPGCLLSVKTYLAIFIPLIVAVSPLVYFDLRHDFLNSSHLFKFLFAGDRSNTGFSLVKLSNSVKILILTFRDILYNQSDYSIRFLNNLAIIFPIGTIFFALINFKKTIQKIFLLAFAVSLVLFAMYKGPLPTQYYFLYLFPVFTLATSDLLHQLSKRTILTVILTIIFGIFFASNWLQVWNPKNDLSLANKQAAVAFIKNNSAGQPVILDTVTHLGLNTGFKYLFWQQQVVTLPFDSLMVTKKFKLVVPSNLAPEKELSARFGSIGVVEWQ